jgi:ABC-type amino acid transport substrate-binding protein
MTTKPKKGVEESKISISVPTLLTLLGLMVTLMLAIAGGVAGVYQSVFIPAAKSELEVRLESLKKQYQDETKLNESKQSNLEIQLAKLNGARNHLLEAAGSPILLSPKNDEILISSQITFQWDYKSEQIPHFIIEITRFFNGTLNRATYSVLQPQNRIFHIPITEDKNTGQYLWRVRPGLISEDREVATGPWSAYQSFWVFTSVKQKIARMRKITVGMYPSFTDKFNLPVPGGRYEGLSVELAHFIADELSSRLPKEAADSNDRIKVEIASYAWQDLLSALSNNAVDMVISSVTAMKEREDRFGIRFSKGYYVTHQMLLSNQLNYDSSRSLMDNLKKMRVGVLKGTSNEQAANYLKEKCTCELEVMPYLELIEAKSALFKREVDVLLTDDIWQTGQSNLATFNQYGPTLDSELSEFYQPKYGRPQDEYGIVVSKKGGDEILQLINEILDTQEAKRFLTEIEDKARGKVLQSTR